MKKINITYLDYINASLETLMSAFQSNITTGLSSQEVHKRQALYGPNAIKERHAGPALILMRQFISPFNIIFLIIAAISFFVHQRENGTIITLCVLINSFVSFYQEYKAQNALKALKPYLVNETKVVRDGQEFKIPSTQTVPGDIILLYPGDIIPADVRLITTENVFIDESMLTGESVPLKKTDAPLDTPYVDIFNASNIGFAGTTIASGKAVGIVFATGSQTIIGDIARVTLETMQESDLTKELSRLGIFMIWVIFITLLAVIAANLFLKGNRLNIYDLFFFSTALAIAVIPEALPVVVTFTLSQGVARLAQAKVVVKRLSAVEDLGTIQILCTDKTGTITENSMTVKEIYPSDNKSAAFYGALASEDAYANIANAVKGFDKALWYYLNPEEQKELSTYQKVAEYPFEHSIKRNAVIICKNNSCEFIARGIPEITLKQCALSQDKYNELIAWYENQGQQGNRVLAIAKKNISYNPHQEIDETNLEFVGLISFVDPLKPTTISALQKAKKLGVEVKILSGDSKEVCGAVGQQLHLIASPDQVITGYDFEQKSHKEKSAIVKNHNVFARIAPEQKYEIITLLQQHDYRVGYMGDGINDAPALKIANVSLAVPDATNIARDVADIILLKKSLLVIINGIEEGRKIVANTLKYIKTTLAASFGNFYTLSIVTLLIDYLPMLPVQLLVVNLITDFPLIAIATDSVDIDEIKSLKEHSFKDALFITFILAMVSSFFDFIFFAQFKGYAKGILQTGWFVLSILTEIVFIFSMRSKRPFYRAKLPSTTLAILSIIACILGIGLPYTSFGQQLIELPPLLPNQLKLIIFIVIAYFCSTELVKDFYYMIKNHKKDRKRKRNV